MNDSDLNSMLRSARIPEDNPEFWEALPERVMAQARRGPVDERNVRARVPSWAWAFGLATACVLAGFMIGHWRGRTSEDNGGVLQSAKLIQEFMALFPNRVQAVIQEPGGFNVVLSEEANVPDSTPLWVRICEGGKCISLVTFSGQELEVAGHRLTVLAGHQGDVIVVGDKFAWTSEDPNGLSSKLKIQARPIEVASLSNTH